MKREEKKKDIKDFDAEEKTTKKRIAITPKGKAEGREKFWRKSVEVMERGGGKDCGLRKVGGGDRLSR